MPSKLVKANQDKESNLPRVSICPLFQVHNYEHTHTHTHTHTHIQEHTHKQRHTHRNTHTQTHTGTHTQRNTHLYGWAGQPSQRSLRSKVWGSDGVPGFYHMHSHPDQGLLQHAFLQLCHPLGKGASAGSGGGAGCTLRRGATKLRPTIRASVPPPWDPPSPVGWGQPQSTGETSAHTGLWP